VEQAMSVSNLSLSGLRGVSDIGIGASNIEGNYMPFEETLAVPMPGVFRDIPVIREKVTPLNREMVHLWEYDPKNPNYLPFDEIAHNIFHFMNIAPYAVKRDIRINKSWDGVYRQYLEALQLARQMR
jgi:hypothetical protein